MGVDRVCLTNNALTADFQKCQQTDSKRQSSKEGLEKRSFLYPAALLIPLLERMRNGALPKQGTVNYLGKSTWRRGISLTVASAPCAPGWFCEMLPTWRKERSPSKSNIAAALLRLQQPVATAYILSSETALPLRARIRSHLLLGLALAIRLFFFLRQSATLSHAAQRWRRNTGGNKLVASNERASRRTCNGRVR